MTNAAGAASGTVYLVGAGPGDPGLLTRHGADALARADVVVYDRLADNSMLALAPADAELIYVGKQAAVHAVPQPRINELLSEHALQGKCVVRLKGGDPFVFGRGGEEASHLRDRGVPFIVVPGVSSAVAVPAYAGIPVTDRRHASSFAVITGHEDPTKPQSRLDWAGIAHGADTLVFLMALTNLAGIAERLVAEGRAPETPAAVIERGTTPGQRVVTGTLADIVTRVREAGLRPPALIVVGDVVRLRDALVWHDSQPLAGRRVLVPRVRRRPSEIVRLLKAAGAETAEVPVLRSETLPAPADLLGRLSAPDWLVFTSPGALESLLEQLAGFGRDVRGLGEARLAAVGPATAAHLRRNGLRVDYSPETAAGFGAGLPALPGETMLLLGEDGGGDHVLRGLDARGVTSTEMPVFRLAVDDRAPLPDVAEFDAVAFASSNTARRFLEAYPSGPAEGQLVVSIGPSTTATARGLGLRVDGEAAEASSVAVVHLIVERLGPAAVS
ncbi:MAG TPA: uroporphyrinogen-III C-methyltransferase [Thermoleophilia bacterium]|nr:uroporphyrinogen-III C-methyltransferase [Thermoleophilia bacterium]